MKRAHAGKSDEPGMMDAEPEDEGLKDAILVTSANNPTAEHVISRLMRSRCTKRYFFFGFLLHEWAFCRAPRPAHILLAWHVHVHVLQLYPGQFELTILEGYKVTLIVSQIFSASSGPKFASLPKILRRPAKCLAPMSLL